MKRKILSVISLVLILVSFVACQTTTTTDTTEVTETTEATVTTVETTQSTEETTETTEEKQISVDFGVLNGDFEFNMQNWEYYTSDGFHDISTSLFRNGEKSLSVENGSTKYTSIWQTIDLNQTDGPSHNDFVVFDAYFIGETTATGTVQLFVENVVDDTTKITIAQSEKVEITDTWTNIATSVGEIPNTGTKLNIVMIFETDGVVNVDDARLSETISNNASLDSISVNGSPLAGFLQDVTEYTVYLTDSTLPEVVATAEKDSSTVVYSTPIEISEGMTITVTAADGSELVYTLNFLTASATALEYIKVNDQEILGFSSSVYDYYVVLESDTLPTLTYDTYFAETTVVVSEFTSVPSTVTLTVTNETSTDVYTINFVVKDSMQYDLPNFDFEETFDWQTWTGTANVPAANATMSHSGVYSLKTYHQSSVWKELEFTAGVPAVGEALKIGAWVYIDSETPLYDFRIKVVGYTESSGSKEVFTEVQIFEGIELQEWVYIESTVEDVLNCDRIQFVIENNADADLYVDDITVIQGTSSNANLDEILVDTVSLSGFDTEVLDYNYLTDGITIPTIQATSQNPNSVVTVTQATEIDGQATILVEAVDGTQITYTVNFLVPSSGLLDNIYVDGVALEGFIATQNRYYVQLDSGTTVFPTVTASAIDQSDVITVTAGLLPGYAIVEVETLSGSVNEYTVYFEVINEQALSTPYPDVNFDKNMENWGVSSGTDVTQSSENYLNGTKSLKMVGGEAWVGFDLAGGDYPSIGNSYSIGMWIYVEGTATSGFRIKLLEKENNLVLINEVMDVSENGHWIYVETAVSDAVSAAAAYLQIVITNETGETVYVDGIRFIEQESTVVTVDTPYEMSGVNLDMESTDAWGFWSPTGSGVSYDTNTSIDTQSLKFDEGSAWIGFGFDGAGFPAKGDTVKLGFWIYVDSSSATSVGGFTIKLLEKDNNDVAIIYTTTDSQFAMDTWVYVETTAATISNTPTYLQIVIEEGTDGTVYVDDIVVIKVVE